MKNDDPIGWSADDYVPSDHILSDDELTALKLEWFKKGAEAFKKTICDNGHGELRHFVYDLYNEFLQDLDSGLIGPLKKEEQE